MLKSLLIFKKAILRYKGSFIGIFILYFIMSIALIASLNVAINSSQYMNSQMSRLGFGDLTIWANQERPIDELVQNIKTMDSVENVKIQPLIFSGYSIQNTHSDNEGQLLAYQPENYDYQFLDENFTPIYEPIEIGEGEIYVSAAMHSTYSFIIGDQISFQIDRSSPPKTWTIKGYFEDPFMGSSMIDMKSFLINEESFLELNQQIQAESEFNLLAKAGAMLHVFQDDQSALSMTEFNKAMNENIQIAQSTEFVYTQSAIYGFMMLLQNMITGFLGAFVIVLLIVSMIMISYSISHSLELERKDMGILKMIGFTNANLRNSQLLFYCISMAGGMGIGFITSITLTKYLSKSMVTSIGLLIPSNIPYSISVVSLFIILCFMCVFIMVKVRHIANISPIQTIQLSQPILTIRNIEMTKIKQKGLLFMLSKRQLIAGKKRYIGTLMISILLAFVLSFVGKINHWIGPHGEGLMNAFSVANHDLGIQPMSNIDMEEIEEIITSYTNIEGVYELAMQNVLVDGVDYTANIITNPSYFHMIRGQTSQKADEIVVTQSVANDLDIDIGDSVNIVYENKNATYIVVGIYQCANEMGANIGMNVEGYERIGSSNSYIWCKHYILSNHSMNETLMSLLQQRYPLDLAVHTNSWSGLEGIVVTMNILTIGMYILVIVLIFIIITLTTAKMLYFEQSDMAILKSIGMTSNQLRFSFTLRFTMVVLLGTIVGSVISVTFSDSLISLLVANVGMGTFKSAIGWKSAILPIAIPTVLFSLFAYLLSFKIKRIALTKLIKGE